MVRPHKSVGNGFFYIFHSDCNGFSLIEVMISAVILTVSLLGVAGMYGFSSKFSYEAKQHGLAVNIAKHVFDGIKINKQAWSGVLLSNNDKKLNIIISERESGKGIKLDKLLPIETDIKSFRRHLTDSFPDGNVCILIDLRNINLSNNIKLDININWSFESDSNSNICSMYESDKINKNYHISTIL